MVTPKPRSGNGSAGVRRSTRTPGTPERGHDTSEGHAWPERGHRLKSLPCWLRASVSPPVTGHPAPSRCPAPPQGHSPTGRTAPSPAIHRSPPCTPKSTGSGCALARSIPIPPAPVLWNWGLCCSAAHKHLPVSPKSPFPAGPGLWWHLDQGHPVILGTGQSRSQPPQTPCEPLPGTAPNTR